MGVRQKVEKVEKAEEKKEIDEFEVIYDAVQSVCITSTQRRRD